MDNWLQIAKELAIGQKIRIQHCNSNETRIVNHDIKGYSWYCFRCKETGFVPAKERTINELVTYKKLKLAQEQLSRGGVVRLPKDFTPELPKHAMLWFLKYGISDEVIKKFNIGYSPKLDRIILPIYSGDELVALQMRAANPADKPKYLNVSGHKTHAALFEAGDKDYQGIKTKTVYIVEDILSAIKLGKIHNTVSILGTNMTNERAMKIKNRYSDVVLWLDGDTAGRKGLRDAIIQMKLFGLKVFKIQTEKDPKEYSLEEIRLFMKDKKEC